MRMRKILGLFLASLWIFFNLPPYAVKAAADSAVYFGIIGGHGQQGAFVEASVYVESGGSPEIFGMELTLRYDSSAVGLVSYQVGDDFMDGNPTFHSEDGALKLLWDTTEAAKTRNGTLLTLRFLVHDTASDGTYPLELTCDEIYDRQFQDLTYFIQNGELTVGKIPLEDLQLRPERLELLEGQQQTLNTVVIPGNATETTLVWDSSDPVVASVDQNGTVTANQTGNAVITATAPNGVYAVCSVAVLPRVLIGIEVTPPNRTAYFTGQALELDGLAVTAIYNNGEKEPIAEGWTVSGYNPNKAGSQTVTVTYGSVNASFSVTVTEEKPVSITISKKPNKTEYIVGETLSTTGMELTVRYNSGRTAAVASGFEATGYDAQKTGIQTITVSYGGCQAAYTVTVKSRVPSAVTSDQYAIKDGIISKIAVGTTAADFLNGIHEKAYVKLYRESTAISGSTPVGTGMTLKLLDGNTVLQTLAIVVTGDTNGDGKITGTDFIQIKAHILGRNSLSGNVAKAADTNGDGKITGTDFIQIKAHILGKSNIQAR